MKGLECLADRIWSPWLLGSFLLVGLYFSLKTGFFQLFGIREWLGSVLHCLFGRGRNGTGGLSQFQAMSTALAATIGTGSIAGVATAIFYGGPGAVFWMWVSAFLGMMIGFVEKTLAVRYRKERSGEWFGGPMEYMEHGMRAKPLALWYGVAVTLAALGGGGMVQSNSIAAGVASELEIEPFGVGIVTALVTGLVLVGGIGRIGRVCEWLTPIMAAAFLLCGGVVLFSHRENLLPALHSIVVEAFAPKPVMVSGLGYGMMTAMRYGVARGVFTNEAGLGSSAMAHAQAKVESPAEQGMWGIFEVFFSTLVICTVSSLVILTSGVYNAERSLAYLHSGQIPREVVGVPLAARAFETVLGAWGGGFLTVCLVLFAFSSLLGWGYYGERGLAYLTGSQRGRIVFRILFLGAVLWGSVGELKWVWDLSDLCNALMAIPNLLALCILSPKAFEEWHRYLKEKEGEHTFKTAGKKHRKS